MDGWVKLHRKFNECSFKRNPLTVALFIHLLTNANHTSSTIIWNKKELIIEAGELITGLKSLSKKTGISIQSIRTGLDILKSTNTITIKTTTKFSIVTIQNWNEYQQVTNKSTNKQQTNNKQATTNKNDKNDKNISDTEIPRTSKNSLTLCTEEELKEIAIRMELDLKVVRRTHEIIKNKIEAKEFKYKTVYYTLKNWLLMGMERGTIAQKSQVTAGYTKVV